jgi:glycosyltransferase involved in cell wall biosynthesis
MAELCYITTCMGRLAHLRETLPRIAGQPGVECVVVDYACPDHAGDWVEATFPQVRVVRVEGETLFNRSRARNLGAAAAQTPWLGFFDADLRIDAGFSAAVLPLLKPGHYFRPAPVTDQTHGALIVSRSDFEAMGGYDETYAGWGSEDIDIVEALKFEGVKSANFPGALLDEIPHSNELRSKFQKVQDLWLQGQINSIYRGVKSDVRRLVDRRLTSAETASIYAEVARVLNETYQRDRFSPSWIRINLEAFKLPPSPVFDAGAITRVERSVTYKVTLRKAAVEPVA